MIRSIDCSSDGKCGSCVKTKVCCNKTTPVNIFQQVSASCSGAIVTSLFMTPLDVVKIRLQQQQHPFPKGQCFYYHNGLMEHVCTACEVRRPCEWYQRPGNFQGTLDAAVKIARVEGVRSLWSGLAPTMVMALPATVFYFTTYDNLSAYIRKRMCCRKTLHPEKFTPPEWTAAMVAGSVARTISVTVVSPIEMVRTKVQSQQMTYKEVCRAVRSSLAAKGISSFYIGWAPTMLRDIPFSGIYWAGYDFLKTRLLAARKTEEMSFGVAFVSGASAGCVASFFTHPFDVIKTNTQVRIGKSADEMSKSMWTVSREMYQTRGFSAFTAGLVPRLFKVTPSCAIMISFYEYFKLFFQKHNRSQGAV